jgi:single-stranded-DNA-specific exonuclease
MIRRVRIKRRRPVACAMADTHPVVARVLAGRGLECAPDYALKSLLPPTMGGLPEAARLLAEAIVDSRSIMVVGDFDTDGATGTALAVRALESMGSSAVRWLVPDRFRHGYGLSPELIADIPGPLPDLLVTVDQGVSSIRGVERAREFGMTVIVTDHHLPGPELPAAHAIVNPNLPDDPFPSPNPAGVAVMFYVLMALRSYLRKLGWFDQRPQPRMDQWLDLVALGTVADLVALDENNRRLVYQGLERIRRGQCAPGIRALLEIAGRNLRHVCASDMGFAAAPRLNAAGRLDDMGIGIRCLLADTEREAFSLAERLDQLNSERRAIQADMQQRAEQQAEQVVERLNGVPQGLCVFDPDWHQGVVGLVAGRLMERLQRPVIAFAPAEAGATELKGSGRSPAGVHMRDLLVAIDHASPGLVGRFGGHARAAGLSLDRARLEAFRSAFDRQLSTISFDGEQVLTDGALASDYLDVATAEALAAAGPWGQAWPEPLFDDRFRVCERRIVGSDHLKMTLQSCQGGPEIDAIAFRAGPLCHQELPDPLHLTYRLEVNRWRGRTRPQLVVQHLVSDG